MEQAATQIFADTPWRDGLSLNSLTAALLIVVILTGWAFFLERRRRLTKFICTARATLSRELPENVPEGVRDYLKLGSLISCVKSTLNPKNKPLFVLQELLGEHKKRAAILEAERNQLSRAMTLAYMGGWELDLTSGVLTWSNQIDKIFDVDPSHFGVSYDSFIGCVHPDDRARVKKTNADALAEHPIYSIDYRVVLKNGATRIVHEHCETIYDDVGHPLLQSATILDITDRKIAEESLRESEERFRQLTENIKQAFWIFDAVKRQVIYVSPAYEEIWGHSINRILQDHGFWRQTIHPDDFERVNRQVESSLLTGGYDETYRIVRPDGEVRWVHDRAYPVNREGELIRVVGIAEDVTEQKTLRQKLESSLELQRALLRRVGEIRESERKNFALVLHDRVGQNLAALGVNLQIVAEAVQKNCEKKYMRRLHESIALLMETTASARELIAEMRPPALTAYGLLAALRNYCKSFELRYGPPVFVEGEEPTPRLASQVEDALFRIAQEALRNVVLHAQASRAHIQIMSATDHCKMSILDNGKGFDLLSERNGSAASQWGLAVMRERAEAIGAELLVESGENLGTRIIVRIQRST